jgi:co-chaperonin GroES (HSP10)
MKLVNNNILIKPLMKNDRIFLKDGNHLFIDTSFEPAKHAETVGIVIDIPDEINKKIMPWECEIEIQKGDIVYFHFKASMDCLTEGKFLIINGEIHYLINYSNLFVAKRENEVICLNGFVLAERIDYNQELLKNRLEKTGLIVPDIEKKDTQWGKVKYLGSPNLSYKHNKRIDFKDLKVNDTIFFAKNADIPLEYSLHASFEGNKEYFRIQRCDILAVVFE